MRRNGLVVLIAVVVLAIGSIAAPYYARLAAPWYRCVAGLISVGAPWQIVGVDVKAGADNPGVMLQLSAKVTSRSALHPGQAVVVGTVQAGAVIEPLLIFWTLLLAWPTPDVRTRWMRLIVGLPVFVLVDTATTVAALLHALPWAANVVAGLPDAATGWDHWVEFLEAGGRFAVVVTAALMTIGATTLLPPLRRDGHPRTGSRTAVAEPAQDCNQPAL